MKELNPIVFDKVTYKRELHNFEQLLNTHTSLSESKHILPFFKENKQISAQVASFLPTFFQIDQIAFEIAKNIKFIRYFFGRNNRGMNRGNL